MRVYATRRRIQVGDRLVADIVHGPHKGEEGISAPITVIGEESLHLADGTIVPWPQGQGAYLERDVSGNAILADLDAPIEGET